MNTMELKQSHQRSYDSTEAEAREARRGNASEVQRSTEQQAWWCTRLATPAGISKG